MTAPRGLPPEAAAFWKRNAPHLEAAGLLTDASRDYFLMLCRFWSELESQPDLDPIKRVALAKQVQNMMTRFGMEPTARVKLKVGQPKEETLADVMGKITGFAGALEKRDTAG